MASWLRGVIGGFAAGFLLYAAIGSAISLAVVFCFGEGFPQCPSNLIGGLAIACKSAFESTLWYAVADLPTHAALYPVVTGLLLFGPPPGTTVFMDGGELIGTLAVLSLSVAGFLGWRTRSPVFAWCLALCFAGEVVIAFAHMWRYVQA